MNTYRTTFAAECPVNGLTVIYRLEIDTQNTIPVERILACTSREKTGLHEEIADRLHEDLGGRQKLTAFHHGVEIETHRPSRPPTNPAEPGPDRRARNGYF